MDKFNADICNNTSIGKKLRQQTIEELEQEYQLEYEDTNSKLDEESGFIN